MLAEDLHISDARVREFLLELCTSTASTVDLSMLLRGILRQKDPGIISLVEHALPHGFGIETLVAAQRNVDGNGDRATANEQGARFTTAALAAIQTFERDQGAASAGGGLRALLASVLAHFGPAERLGWGPLNVSRLRSACVPGAHLETPPASSIPLPADPGFEDLFAGLPWDNLTERAHESGCEHPSPLSSDSGYAAFFETFCRALHRSIPRHVLLVREHGVGEQVAMIEMARRALDGSPAFLRATQFVTVDCRHVPTEQIRRTLEALLAKASRMEKLVLCVDGLPHLLRSPGGPDNRSVLLSSLARARSRVVFILTPQEYEENISSDAELHELFSVITLCEPDIPVAVEVIRHFAKGLQSAYRVLIEDPAIRASVVLSASYILSERLPYKAVKVLRALCDDVEYDRLRQSGPRDRITESDVIAKIAEISGVPEAALSGLGERIDYIQNLGDLIVGQEHAVREVATELGLIKSGFVDSNKPASVMMFVGQTGTGKTEMAKALARFYSSSKRLKTFTLGNFSEPHSVSGIIGVPPGYVGHDQGGRLVNELNADPYGVFLLDEADKAHPDVIQPFLNLFDEGWIYDQRGVKAYAHRAIFILTTNVAQRQIADMCKSGKSIEEITWTLKETLSRIRHTKSNRPVFTPEFLARVKRIVVFRSLDMQAMSGICQRLVHGIQEEWQTKRQKSLLIPDVLVDAVAQQAFQLNEKSQGKEGGRIVRKLLADVVESKIMVAIGQAPDAYRACRTVVVSYTPYLGDAANRPFDLMSVHFEMESQSAGLHSSRT